VTGVRVADALDLVAVDIFRTVAVLVGVPVLPGVAERLILRGGVAVRVGVSPLCGVLVGISRVRACPGVDVASPGRTERSFWVAVAVASKVTGAVRARFAVGVASNRVGVLIASAAASATSRASTVGAGSGPWGSRPSNSRRTSLNQKMVVRAVSTTVIATPLRVRRRRLLCAACSASSADGVSASSPVEHSSHLGFWPHVTLPQSSHGWKRAASVGREARTWPRSRGFVIAP
jgi:hypothetical protein